MRESLHGMCVYIHVHWLTHNTDPIDQGRKQGITGKGRAAATHLPVDPAQLGNVEDGGRLHHAVQREALDQLLPLCLGT